MPVLNERDNLRCFRAMDYREVEAPQSLRPLVKLGWTLSVPDDGPEWTTHVATPDGCMELIRRIAGRSDWNGAQPDAFVAGAISRPAELRLSPGSQFIALRIWPWAWRLISGQAPGALMDRWLPLDQAAADLHLPETIAGLFDVMAAYRASPDMRIMAEALAPARTPDELARHAGMSPRTLQRWFASHVGVPPRTYLRLVRFSDALASLPNAQAGLAGHAIDHGFADQAHMAREFRSLAGAPAKRAKAVARGPFIARPANRD